ncbi:Voltage-dependent calcium channel subunit alpha-2/delta-1-like 2 [Homarus americanus]|uniref:Voltage-dependent calcium channel subunit alpha-2/delta-1-like 2 n=1 Tax=Homarus americanus TaxID=6706 RepID=A0A8J5N3X6_HOMAM|nr:Voltage-dependent calcium channel subunit alpha-2/delta-1-like 2 [Homarus americanus]
MNPEILNGLHWSATVDRVFQENFEGDSTLAWQYFGAQTGFMRVYPATTWYVPPNLIDLYDARLRPWYVQGSVSPKDMIILMDRSGSVHGQTFTIMKWAVKTLIDTLGENDFVNVAAFNSTTEWVNNCSYCEVNNTTDNLECTQPLVQASTTNKKLLFQAIDKLEDGGMASYTNALTFAYDAFKQFEGTRKEGEGANCHKTIMLFSDGGTEWPEEVFKKFHADNYTKSVRVFTYAVGPHPIPTAVLKQMACSTGGKYSVITTRSSVRTKIQV